ncbi:YihY/virulence factor BrkB family protein [Almyronema epifaneia]|uniref:YihY/virulence factor BrkB family protein n=1 Tax=Almyronema epifaneia S1 TaxID=2991925 RepID=A0ABW6IIP2_9CYAN
MHERTTLLNATIRNTFQATFHLGCLPAMSLRRLRRSLSIRAFWRFLCHINFATIREVIVCTFEQRLPGLAAEMAYYSMLGLFPSILAVLTAIGLIGTLRETFDRLAWQLSEIAPQEALTLIQNFAGEISNSQNRSLFSISFLVALWASSGAISAAMRALDQIHQIPSRRMRPFWKAKLVSLGLTAGTILLIILASSLFLISEIIIFKLAFQSGATIEYWILRIWRWLSLPTALGILSVTIAFIYRFGPSRWSPGKPLIPGAVLAALAWAGLSSAFRLYVSHFGNYNKVYGAVGAVIVLMLWLYLSSLVLLIGDQLNVSVGKAMGIEPLSERQNGKRLAPAAYESPQQ